MRAHWLVALLAGACHGGSSPVTPDGAVENDAAVDGAVPADASADAPPAAAFAFDPPMLDFGYVDSNTVSAPLRLTVLNNNSVAIPQFALVLSGDDTIDLHISQTTCASTLDPGGCWIDLTYAPRADGDHMMAITASAPGVPSATATIHAIGGVEPHPFTAGLPSLDFGTVIVGDVYGKLVRYYNRGTTTLPPASFRFAGESPDQWFLAQDHCTGVQLAPMDSCTVVVVYAPTSLRIPGDAILYGTAMDTDEIDLRAGPTAATTLSVSPPTYDFGNVGPQPSAIVPFMVTNTGSVTATGIAPTISSPQFSLTSSTCGLLAPGASCTLNLQLVPLPATTGPLGGGMTIYSDNAVEAGARFTSIITPPEGVILDTWAHDFGTTAADTIGSSYTFTVTNVGTTATPVTLSLDSDAAAFTLANDNCSATSLAASATCTFDIVFTPKQVATSHFARVHATSASNEAIAQLTGISTPGDQPLSLAGYNFGTDGIGQIVIQQFSVVHEGGTPKTPTMSVTGPNASEFQLVNDTCTGVMLSVSGASCTVDIWYRPATVGTKSATLTADWGAGSTKATLDAGAFEDSNPFVNADLPALDFGTVAVGQSASRGLTFKNFGAATSPPVAFLLDGIDPTEFSLASDLCTGAVLANGDSCTVTVVFTPQSPGTKHSSLQVQVRDGGDPKLTGVGQ